MIAVLGSRWDQPRAGKYMQKRKMNVFGREMDVMDVDVVDRKESVAEYTLEDGAVIRVANPLTRVTRLEGQFSGDGDPIYIVLTGTATTVISAPDTIKKPPG